MLIVFTDLDRCLLDENYRFDTALGAVNKLLDQKHRLIINSSKTKAEITHLLSEMGINIPYIVENGSAIYIPEGFLGMGSAEVVLGCRFQEIEKGMEVVRSHLGPVDSFSSLSVRKLMEVTGLDEEGARRAKMREYSEPFIYPDPLPEGLLNELSGLGLRIIRGRSFCHLLGNTDKGKATGKFIEMIMGLGIPFRSVAIGDGPNDIGMLDLVDIPFLTQTGPSGWKDFVTKLLEMDHG